MKKIISLMLAVLVCVSLAAIAAADTFTPSVTYKAAPILVSAHLNGEDVKECVVVTSVQDARKKTTDITQEERDLLIEVYEKLADGSMKVEGLPEDYVIRDLMDISFLYSGCRQIASHGEKHEELAKNEVLLETVLDLNIGKNVDVIVMTYINGEWAPIERVENNGDGTLTCDFEDICPVLFAVKG